MTTLPRRSTMDQPSRFSDPSVLDGWYQGKRWSADVFSGTPTSGHRSSSEWPEASCPATGMVVPPVRRWSLRQRGSATPRTQEHGSPGHEKPPNERQPEQGNDSTRPFKAQALAHPVGTEAHEQGGRDEFGRFDGNP